MMSNPIDLHLSRPLAEFVETLVGDAGPYASPEEYVGDMIRRDLIRRDMEQRDGWAARDAILTGYRDLAEGAVFQSSGTFQENMRRFEEKEAAGWR